jgi:hypothetical protein
MAQWKYRSVAGIEFRGFQSGLEFAVDPEEQAVKALPATNVAARSSTKRLINGSFDRQSIVDYRNMVWIPALS